MSCAVPLRITSIEDELSRFRQCEQKISECESCCKSMNEQLHELVNKVDDMENRSRRNNLVIYGVTEDSDEEARTLENKIKEGIFKDTLDLEVKSIERIHRIGNRYGQRPRPIILRLFDYREKNKILSCCNKLKGTPISISEDFSKRIRDIRSNLWRSAAIERANGTKASLSFDKLRLNGRIYTWDPDKRTRVEITRNVAPTLSDSHNSSSAQGSTKERRKK